MLPGRNQPNESNEHRQVFATSGNHEVLGRLLRREGDRLKISDADEKASATDGAEWIIRQLACKVPMLDERILDFYHFSEHAWVAVNICFKQVSIEAQQLIQYILPIASRCATIRNL